MSWTDRLNLFQSSKSSARAFLCQLSLVEGKTPEWIELIPAGPKVDAVDGRKFRNETPDAVVKAFQDYAKDLPIDLEHATEIKAPKGEPAPAAGWITALENRNGAIWAKVEWTPSGAAALTSREYRYVSPAFLTDKKGNVTSLSSAGLVNKPALTQLADVAAVISSKDENDLPDSCFLYVESGGDEKDSEGKTVPRSLRHFPYKHADGSIDLAHLRNALARIPDSDVPEDVKKSITAKAEKLLAKADKAMAHLEEDPMNKDLLKLLGLAENATEEQAVAACQKLVEGQKAAEAAVSTARAELAKAQTPDLNKFVPRADHELALARAEKAEKQIADEKAAAFKREVETEVDAAVKAGKVAPASKEFYLSTCASAEGLEKFRKFISAAPVIAPDSGLDDRKVTELASGQGTGFTEGEIKMARNCGLTVADLAKAYPDRVAKK